MPRSDIKLLSPAIKAASAFAIGGAAFALANLLLARYLTTQDFGTFSLLLSITMLSIPLGPFGLDAVVLRHRPGPQIKLLGLSIMIGGIGAVLVIAAATKVYALDSRIMPAVAIAITAGSATKMGASIFQSVGRFKLSFWLVQSENITLLAVALAAGVLTSVTSNTVFSLYAVHWVLVAILGWLMLFHRSGVSRLTSWAIPWPEIPALLGYVIAHNLSIQLDKLLIPKFLDIESLATFGVLSPLVLAPFKMLQAGVGYTLIPGLKAAASQEYRKKIAIHEAKTTAVVVSLAAISGFLVAPWVAEVFLAGKYELGPILIASAVFAGLLRVAVTYLSSIVTALGSSRQLSWMTRGSWLGLAGSAVGGWWGAQWGLPGFIFGFTIGILIRAGFALVVATRVWRAQIPVQQ